MKCIACPLYKTSKVNCLPGEGPKSAEMVFVGEAPGAVEERRSRVFVGRAGIKLNEIFKNVNLERKSVCIENVLHCRPPGNRTPTKKEIDACRPILFERLKAMPNLKVIVAMGKVALTAFGHRGAVRRLRGRVLSCDEFPGVKIKATYHPSAVLRTWEYEETLTVDIRSAIRLLKQQELEVNYTIAENLQQVESIIETLSKSEEIVVDLETTGLDFLREDILCVSLRDEDQSFLIPLLGQGYKEFWEEQELVRVLILLKELLENPEVKKVGQNFKFDQKFLANYGIEVKGFVFDTMLVHHLLNENLPHDLNFLISQYTSIPLYDEKLKQHLPSGDKRYMVTVPDEVLWEYAANDGFSEYEVSKEERKELYSSKKLTWLYENIVHPLSTVAMHMEQRGMLIDVGKAEEITEQIKEQEQGYKEDICEHAGIEFNVDSPRQLANVLYKELRLPVLVRTKPSATYPQGNASTSAKALQALRGKHPIIDPIGKYKELHQLRTTFLRSETGKGMLQHIYEDGRLRTTYSLNGTPTGRFASSGPNLQNIPTDAIIRNIFVAPPGFFFVTADYSQLEVRICAFLAGEIELLDALAAGYDVHTVISEGLFPEVDEIDKDMRDIAKVFVFGLFYGRGFASIGFEFGWSRRETEKRVRNFWTRFKKIKRWRDTIRKQIIREGQLESLFGRIRRLGTLKSQFRKITREKEHTLDEQYARMLRQALNFPVQSAGADITHMASIRLDSEFVQPTWESRLIANLHDELQFEIKEEEAPKAVATIKEEMERSIEQMDNMVIPVKVKIGRFWGDPNAVEV